MNWGSMDALLAMGGYGTYVWSSVIVCTVAVLAEVVGVKLRRRRALAQLRGRGTRSRRSREWAE